MPLPNRSGDITFGHRSRTYRDIWLTVRASSPRLAWLPVAGVAIIVGRAGGGMSVNGREAADGQGLVRAALAWAKSSGADIPAVAWRPRAGCRADGIGGSAARPP